LRSPVDFDQAVRALARSGHQVFVEVSPRPVLTAAITQTLEGIAGHEPGLPDPVVTGTLRRGDGGPARLLASRAPVPVPGVAVDWAAVLGGGQCIELPTYAFQRQRYWLSGETAARGAAPFRLAPDQPVADLPATDEDAMRDLVLGHAA